MTDVVPPRRDAVLAPPRTPSVATPWRTATVLAVRPETDWAATVALEVPGWPGHRAGQRVDVRLQAEDGYRTQRPYSIATAGEEDAFELCVWRMPEGEVSPFMVDELRAGDTLEVRGPVGSAFSWDRADGGPLLLVAGGAGLVPLRGMVRHRIRSAPDVECTIAISARSREELLYADELDGWREAGVDVRVALTRRAPAGWTGMTDRLDAAALRAIGPPASAAPHVFVCGSVGFAEDVASALVGLGHDPLRVRTERFGGG